MKNSFQHKFDDKNGFQNKFGEQKAVCKTNLAIKTLLPKQIWLISSYFDKNLQNMFPKSQNVQKKL